MQSWFALSTSLKINQCLETYNQVLMQKNIKLKYLFSYEKKN